ncbi:MAG: hypothetical protein AAF497_18715 [Planctomycetota bacterium]
MMAMEFSALGRTRLADIKMHGVRSLRTGKFTVTGMTIDGQLVIPTQKFWDNLFRRFGLTHGWAQAKSNARRFEWLVSHYGEYQLPYRLSWDINGNTELWPAPDMKMRRPVLRKRRKSRTEPSCRIDAAHRTSGESCQEAAAREEKIAGYATLLSRVRTIQQMNRLRGRRPTEGPSRGSRLKGIFDNRN